MRKERAAKAHTWESTDDVSPDHPKHGIGTTHMNGLIPECRARASQAHIACITGNHTPSIHLQEKLGYRQESRLKQGGNKLGQTPDVVDLEPPT